MTFVTPGYPSWPVGGMKVVYEHANGLAARGHRVRVIHPRYRSHPAARRPPTGLERMRDAKRRLSERIRPPRVTWQRVDPRVDLRFVPSLHPAHVPEGDAVIATAWWTAEFVGAYPTTKGTPFVLLQHYEDWMGPRARVDETWRAPLRKVAVSSWLVDKGRELGVADGEIRLVPNGIDPHVFRVLAPIESRPPRVAAMADARDWKGTADLVRALELVRSRHSEVTAAVFGVDPRPAGLPPWASYVRRPSAETLVARVYNASAIFVCASWSEGWGLPSTEAMACGCALVTTPVVGDYAVEGVTALVAPARDPAALAERIERLLTDPRRRAAIAHAGRAEMERRTWDASTTELERALTDGVAGRWPLRAADPAPPR